MDVLFVPVFGNIFARVGKGGIGIIERVLVCFGVCMRGETRERTIALFDGRLIDEDERPVAMGLVPQPGDGPRHGLH